MKRVVKIILAPAIWCAFAVSLNYFLSPYLEISGATPGALSWPGVGKLLLVLFIATLLTLLVLSSPRKKSKPGDPIEFSRRDMDRDPVHGTEGTIDVLKSRPEIEKIE